jgi:hypothetical protein
LIDKCRPRSKKYGGWERCDYEGLFELMPIMLHILDTVFTDTVHRMYTIPNKTVLSDWEFYMRLENEWCPKIENGSVRSLEELYRELLGRK